MLDRITLFILIPENIFNLSIHSWFFELLICSQNYFFMYFPHNMMQKKMGLWKKSLFFIVYLLLHWLERTYWIIGLLNNHTQYSLPWKSYLCRYQQRLSGNMFFFFVDDFSKKKLGIFFAKKEKMPHQPFPKIYVTSNRNDKMISPIPQKKFLPIYM